MYVAHNAQVRSTATSSPHRCNLKPEDRISAAGHLFGRERTALTAVREPFKDAFGPHCFYCGMHLPAKNPIDHVLPWSLVGIDGLANIVLACARCNGDKSGALPAVTIVDRVMQRERDVLDEIAAELQWPTQHDGSPRPSPDHFALNRSMDTL